MISVTHVITTISRGGAENQLLILCREQIRQGLDVRVIPLKGTPELLEEFLKIGVKVDLSLLGKSFLKQVLLVISPKYASDIWHSHLPQAELLLVLKKRKKLVITRHFGGKFYPEAPRFISNLLSQVATWNVKKVIAISDHVAKYLVSSGEVTSPESIKIVKYGFSQVEFSKEIRSNNQTVQKDAGKLKFVSLARLSPEKDLQTMISGFCIYIREHSPNSRLEIFGEGSEKEKLTELIRTLGLTNHVFLKGRTDNVPKTLSEFDCFILSSRFEGFGMVLLEAMAANLPIVCSRIPAALEVLGEEGAATYFSPGNARELADTLKNTEFGSSKVRQNEQLNRLNLFSSKKMSEEILKVYQEIMSQRN